jgi:hypothetical protein
MSLLGPSLGVLMSPFMSREMDISLLTERSRLMSTDAERSIDMSTDAERSRVMSADAERSRVMSSGKEEASRGVASLRTGLNGVWLSQSINAATLEASRKILSLMEG